MERILLAMDAGNPDKNTAEFACYLARLTKSKITGVFLESPALTGNYANGGDGQVIAERSPVETMKWFSEKCINEETRFDFLTEHGIPAKEMVAESRYADLVVIDAETSFSKIHEGIPSRFVNEFLHKSECPVVIAPERFDGIDEIVVAYDNSASSVFALKQFSYLFPELNRKKITIIHVSDDGHGMDAEKEKFIHWLKNHYTDMHFLTLKGEPDGSLFSYLLRRKNVFLVMGAYGRSNISRFLKHSRAELIIKTITQPIFIAHLK